MTTLSIIIIIIQDCVILLKRVSIGTETGSIIETCHLLYVTAASQAINSYVISGTKMARDTWIS